MEVITLFKYLALFLGTYLITKQLIQRFFKFSKLPPSPSLALPIIGHLHLFKKPLHLFLGRLAAQHGPVLYLRFGSRPVVLLSSTSAVEESLVRSDVFVDRPRLVAGKYNGFDFSNIAWAPMGPHWRNLRRVAAVEVLSPQRLHTLLEVRDNVARTFLGWMMKEITLNGVVEMKSAIFRLTLDNMMRMLVGYSFYEEVKGQDKEETFRKLQKIVEDSFRLGGVSNMEDFMPIIKVFKSVFGSPEVKFKELMDEKLDFMKGLMEEHIEMEKEGKLNETRKKSMLHVLLCLQKDDPKYYSNEMIQSFIWTLYQGGTDTSSATAVWAMSLLINHPQVLKKAQAEIDALLGNERLVKESDRINLPYVQCIVNETLRMYPAGPAALPYVANADTKVAGYQIPKGTMLLYNIWAIHNDPKVWDEPRKFKPERFMDFEENKFGNSFMPFGVGRRVCPGEHLARRIVWLAVAILAQCFDWETVDGEMVDMEEGGGQTSFKVEPLLAKCRPRPGMMNVLSQL
ncbi:hypothetical protein RND81_03G159900 [Saponaria officinalis]|uniref:Cytochrome P450 n=1 Tax=Saponaria officinalis TaxID=3572 RepID=A0AAW1M0T9_SAPOF